MKNILIPLLKYINTFEGRTITELLQSFKFDKATIEKINSRTEFEEKVGSHLGVNIRLIPFKRKNQRIIVQDYLFLQEINYYNFIHFDKLVDYISNLFIVFYEIEENKLVENKISFVRGFSIINKQEIESDKSLYLYLYKDDLMLDYKTIQDFTHAGKAHLISESISNNLCAIVKIYQLDNIIDQPMSEIKTIVRYFAFKPRLLSKLLTKSQNIVSDNLEANLNSDMSRVEERFLKELQKFYGKTVGEILENIPNNISLKSKSALNLLCRALTKEITNNNEEFQKINFKLKTIRLEPDGSIKESMSFPVFKFTDIVKETWKDSQLRHMFLNTRFLFIVFQKAGDNLLDEHYLLKAKFWSMPNRVLEKEIKDTWNETVRILKNDLVHIEGFPKSNFNQVCHVRPHARNRQDTLPLPSGGEYTKQCFWLDRRFIMKIINEL